MNKVIVKTYLKKINRSGLNPDDFFLVDNGQGVEINADLFSGHLMYVEGAIIIDVYGKSILNFEHYDYPFWMWGQIHNQLENISAGKGFEVPFLETQRTLIVESNNPKNYQVKLLSLNNIDSNVSVPKKDFLKPLIHSAIQSYNLVEKYQKNKYNKWIKEFEEVYKDLISS